MESNDFLGKLNELKSQEIKPEKTDKERIDEWNEKTPDYEIVSKKSSRFYKIMAFIGIFGILISVGVLLYLVNDGKLQSNISNNFTCPNINFSIPACPVAPSCPACPNMVCNVNTTILNPVTYVNSSQ